MKRCFIQKGYGFDADKKVHTVKFLDIGFYIGLEKIEINICVMLNYLGVDFE